jgi:hypothetical protein
MMYRAHRMPALAAALFLCFWTGRIDAVSGQACIYNPAPYGLGTGYRLDSIVGPDWPGGKTYQSANTFDSAGNPVSHYSMAVVFHSAPQYLQSAYRLDLREGVLSSEAVASPVRYREYLGQAFLVDSAFISRDSGRTFHIIGRNRRSGDTVWSEEWSNPENSPEADERMTITFPEGDSILTYRMTTRPATLSEVCRPQGDTCMCTNLESSGLLTRYVVEHGLLKYFDSGDLDRRWYIWRTLASIPVRKPIRKKAHGSDELKAGFTADGRNAVSKRDGMRHSASVVFPLR